MSLAETVAKALGNGKEKASGGGWLTCCPVHGDTKPSLSVTDTIDSYGNPDVIVNCHTGCGWKEIKDELRARDLLPELKPERGSRATTAGKPAKLSTAAYIWQHSKPDFEPIRKSFLHRGIDLPALHPSIRLNTYDGKKQIVCAMQHPFATDTPTEPEAIHITTLDEDGRKTGTRYHGSKKGLAVLLYVEGTSLVIGEGLETTLSAMQATGFSGMVAGDAGNLASLSRMHGQVTTNIYILVDSDTSFTGQKSALLAAGNIAKSNKYMHVFIVTPDDSCFTDNPIKMDFNDLQPDEIKARFDLAENPRDFERLKQQVSEKKTPATPANIERLGRQVGYNEPLEKTKQSGILDALQPATTVTPKKVEWLWKPIYAIGKFSLLAARGGAGKTSICCEQAARISTGAGWPLDPSSTFPKSSVLFVTAEDDPEDTLLPRFLAAGGNPEHLTFLSSSKRHLDMNTRPEELAAIVESIPDLSLVILDPVTSMTGDLNTHVDSNVKRIAGILSGIAIKNRIAILGIIHFRKGDPAARGQSLVDMVTGSAGWVNSARVALACFVDDKTDKGYFGVIKSNVGRQDYTLEYSKNINRDEVVEIEYQELQQRNIEKIIRQIAARDGKESKAAELMDRAINRYGEFFSEHGIEPAPMKEVRNYIKERIGTRITDNEMREAEKKGGYQSKPGGKGKPWVMHPPGCKCEKCSPDNRRPCNT